MASEPHNPVEVFYSYAHEDEKLRDELKKHLSNLKRQGVITDWYDRDISAGREWNSEIERHLNSAKVILLLISPDFMNSEYINDVEVKRAMERHESGEARVIPVILRPVDWQGAPFSKLQSLPSDVRAVTLWENQDEAFLDVTSNIRSAIQDLPDPSFGTSPILDIPGPPKVGFVSRKDRDNRDIIDRLRQELSPHVNQLVVLWGAGGVGKTAIAAEAARGLVEPFAKRVIWVSADGLESFGFTTLLDAIANQLGNPDLRKLAPDMKKAQVRDLVKTAPTLIVLDNFETIEPAEGVHCVDWLGKPAPCTALITTRDVIQDARNIPIDVLRLEEANNLLDQLIAQAHEVKAFAKLDRERLIKTAEANPLVLQWIVGQIDLAQDPDEVLDELQHGEGSAADRVFNRSYELKQLNNGGRAVLLALSLFAPSATRKAVAEVSGLGRDADRRKFRDAVRSLSALWLIHTKDDSTRLAVEGLTRELTSAKLSSDPRGKTFGSRFVSRFVNYANSHAKQTREDYDSLELEKDNLQAAAEIAFSQENWQGVIHISSILAVPEHGVLNVRGYWDEAIKVSTLALKAATSSKSKIKIAHASIDLAGLYFQSSATVQAKLLYERSLEIATELGNARQIASSKWGLGMVASHIGELDEASKNYQEALEVFQKLQDKPNIAGLLHQLGALADVRGDTDEAQRLYDESSEIEQTLGNQGSIAISLRALGRLAYARGDIEQARDLFYQSLDISKKLGNQAGIARDLHILGWLAFEQGDIEQASRLFHQSLEINKKLGNQGGIASDLHALGGLAFDQGDIEQAKRLYNESLGIDQKRGNPSGIASNLHALGRLASNQGDIKQASDLFHQSLVIGKKLGSQGGIASDLHALGGLAFDQGDIEQAKRLYNESLGIDQKRGNPSGIAGSLRALGRLASNQGDIEQASRLFHQSLEINKKLGNQAGIASDLHALGGLAFDQGDIEQASRLFHQSLEINKKLGNQGGISSDLHALGGLAFEQGDIEQARRLYSESLRIDQKRGNQLAIAGSFHQLGTLCLAEGDYEGCERLLKDSLSILRGLGSEENIAECLESIAKSRTSQLRFGQARPLLEEALQIAEKIGIQFRIASVKHSLGILAKKEDQNARAAELFREALPILEKLRSPKAEQVRKDLEEIEARLS